jgi:hypothetical protein
MCYAHGDAGKIKNYFNINIILRPPVASTQAAYDKPIPRPDAQKELWIFWYTSDEPKFVENFKSRGLFGKYL